MKSRYYAVGLFVLLGVMTATPALTGGGCGGGTFVGSFGGAGDFLSTGRTLSFFRAIQVDPRSEDSAGPQFVVAADVNGDGLKDLVSAWNQTQPIQIHLQRRTAKGAMQFETVTLAGNIPVVRVAGLAVADFDLDGHVDIAVLVKEALMEGSGCLGSGTGAAGGLSGLIVVYFGPDDPAQVTNSLAWVDQDVGSSLLAGIGGQSDLPETGGYTSMAVGDIDSDGDMDIVVAANVCGGKQVLVLTNAGGGSVRDGAWPLAAIADAFGCDPSSDNCSDIRDVALGDIDRDGDLDIVSTYPTAGTLNIRWQRNPLIAAEDGCYVHDGAWKTGTVGQIATGADIVRIGDIDRDGILDVVVRSTAGRVIQWFKGPECPTTPTSAGVTDPFRNLPWQVYTLAEFKDRTPQSMALGDLTNDGQLDVIVSAEGALMWLNSRGAPMVYDQWKANLIIDEKQDASTGPATTDPNVSPAEVGDTTIMNSIIVTDLDGDGRNDLVVTLDRSGLSGLTNDALVWFRNVR